MRRAWNLASSFASFSNPIAYKLVWRYHPVNVPPVRSTPSINPCACGHDMVLFVDGAEVCRRCSFRRGPGIARSGRRATTYPMPPPPNAPAPWNLNGSRTPYNIELIVTALGIFLLGSGLIACAILGLVNLVRGV